ncbi:MAG: hypothetical protein AAGK00_15185, partial [Pseudomonadota bacterium]
FRRSSEREGLSPDKGADFRQQADSLDAAADELVRLAGLTSALPQDIGNVHDLPEDLLAELSVVKTDDLEDQIVTVINAYEGVADIDRVLIGLYRKFSVKQKRRFIQNKLWRMKDNGILWTVPGRKGVYSTSEPVDEVEHPEPQRPDPRDEFGPVHMDEEDASIPF